MTIRAARGRFGGPGPGAIWYRIDRGRWSRFRRFRRRCAPRPRLRFLQCPSSALDYQEWTFLNADLTVSMAREPVGDWILLDAVRDRPGWRGARRGAARRYQRLFRPLRAKPRHREALGKTLPTLPLSGGCSCGAIRYEITSFPPLLYACNARIARPPPAARSHSTCRC